MPADIGVLCDLLDGLLSPNPLYTTEAPVVLGIPGLDRAESVALEASLHRVVRRFREMEERVTNLMPEVAAGKAPGDGSQINRQEKAQLAFAAMLTPPESAQQGTRRPPSSPHQLAKGISTTG